MKNKNIMVIHCPKTKNSLSIRSLIKNLKRERVIVESINWFGFQFPISILELLSKKLRGFTIIHFHWLPFNWFFMMKIIINLCYLLDIKIAWTIHNLEPHISQFSNIKNDKLAMKYMAKHASIGIVHSESIKKNFIQMYGNILDVHVIHYGNFFEFVKTKERNYSRQKLKIPDNKIVQLFFPPNRWGKGIKTFIEVIEKLPENYIGLFIGKANNKEIRKYIIDKSIKIPNRILTNFEYISSDELGYYFSASDIFFMPFEKITTSSSVMYAMSYEKPIISTPKGHLELLVKNGVNGYLCNNTKEMIKKIESINIQRAADMGKESYKIVKKYTWEDYTTKTIEIYNKIIGLNNKT